MNVERLHSVAAAIVADFKKTRCVNIVEQLVSALQNMANQPQQPSHQAQVSKAREELAEVLVSSDLNYFSPTLKQVLEEIGVADYIGSDLHAVIEEIISRNAITPSVAHAELNKVLQGLKTIASSAEGFVDACSVFGIGEEVLEPGECEVGVLVPRLFVDNQLDKLGVEIGELDKIFRVFAEITTGSRPGFKVRTVSTTDFSIFIDMAPAVAACVAVSVERMVALYRQLLEIRKLQNGLKEQGLRENDLKGIADYANGHMNNGIDALVKELIDEHCVKADAGRKNELSIELRYTLKKIANRIDRGFNLEVTMAPPAKPVEGKDAVSGKKGDEAKLEMYLKTIDGAAEGLQFLKLDGKSILSLSEKEQPAKEQPAAKKKK